MPDRPPSRCIWSAIRASCSAACAASPAFLPRKPAFSRASSFAASPALRSPATASIGSSCLCRSSSRPRRMSCAWKTVCSAASGLRSSSSASAAARSSARLAASRAFSCCEAASWAFSQGNSSKRSVAFSSSSCGLPRPAPRRGAPGDRPPASSSTRGGPRASTRIEDADREGGGGRDLRPADGVVVRRLDERGDHVAGLRRQRTEVPLVLPARGTRPASSGRGRGSPGRGPRDEGEPRQPVVIGRPVTDEDSRREDRSRGSGRLKKLDRRRGVGRSG